VPVYALACRKMGAHIRQRVPHPPSEGGCPAPDCAARRLPFSSFNDRARRAAPECGVRDDSAAWRLKALCATRSFALWLNKGIDVLHYFDAYEDKANRWRASG